MPCRIAIYLRACTASAMFLACGRSLLTDEALAEQL
jgi:hypothetical protein